MEQGIDNQKTAYQLSSLPRATIDGPLTKKF